ncbi:MAG: nodulation protein NfeD, partial [Rhodothermaceae bacterium]|nr:nodulation protein NfeD [Rhodothermaceae bacterium]
MKQSLLLLLPLLVPSALAQVRAPKPLELNPDTGEGPVFVVPVNGMIDNGLARYIDRAVEDATGRGATLTVFEIDTFGGLVDAADKIRKTLLNAEMPTVAFI